MGYIVLSLAGVDVSAMGPIEEEEAMSYLKRNNYSLNERGVLTKWEKGFPSLGARWVPELTGFWHPALISPFSKSAKI